MKLSMILNSITSLSSLISSFSFNFSDEIDVKYTLTNMKNINIDNYELIFIDIDGVLISNEKENELAVNTFNILSDKGKNICMLSNECNITPKMLRDTLIKMGFRINLNTNILTAIKITLIKIDEILKKKGINIRNKKNRKSYNLNKKYINIGIIGNDNFFYYIKKKLKDKYIEVNFFFINDTIIPDNLDYLIISDVNKKMDNLIEKCVKWFSFNSNNENKFEIIFTHNEPNNLEHIFTPPELIHILKEKLYYENIKIDDYDKTYFGKLAYCEYVKKNFKDLFNKDNTSDKNKMLVVGDSIKNDIHFADNIGADKCLVLSGITKINNINKENIKNIDYIVPDISYLIYN